MHLSGCYGETLTTVKPSKLISINLRQITSALNKFKKFTSIFSNKLKVAETYFGFGQMRLQTSCFYHPK